MFKLLLISFSLFASINIEVPNDVQGEKYEYATAVVILSAEEAASVSKIKVTGASNTVYSECVKSYYKEESCVFIIKTYLEEDKSCLVDVYHNGKKTSKEINFRI